MMGMRIIRIVLHQKGSVIGSDLLLNNPFQLYKLDCINGAGARYLTDSRIR